MSRADKLLQESYPQLSRNKIQSLIERKKIYYSEGGPWFLLQKASQKFPAEKHPSLQWRLQEDEESQFVSRAGFKLEKTLQHFDIDVSGKLCLDVGLSTGGFSHCLLQRGVQKILGIDVGHSQLHPQLQSEDRLVSLDKVNARDPLPGEALHDFFASKDQQFDLIVIDVSFISLDKIIENISQYLRQQGLLLALVKPQFEVGKGNLNKQGVVKDSKMVDEVVKKNIELFTHHGLEIQGQVLSPIEGENGNQEVFLYAQKA